MQLLSSLFVLLAAVPQAIAVYKDEAFHTDYHLPLLGTVISPLNTFFHKPTASSPASLLYSLTNRLVLGAIHPRDGSLVWRQQLATGSVTETEAVSAHTALRKGSDGNVVTAVAGNIALWDAGNGKKVWGNRFSEKTKDLIVLDKEGVVVVAFMNGLVRGLSLDRGDVKWETQVGEGNDETLSITSSPNKLHLVLHTSNTRRLKTVLISANTGTQLETQIPETFDSSQKLVTVPASLPIAAWRDNKALKLHLLGTKSTTSVNLADDVQITIHAASANEFVVAYSTFPDDDDESPNYNSWAELYVINGSNVKKTFTLPTTSIKSVYSVSLAVDEVLISRLDVNEINVYNSKSITPVVTFRYSTELTSEPKYCNAEVLKRADGTYTARTSLTLVDGNLVLLRNGDISWAREESLASAIASEWVELHDTEPGLERALLTEESSNVVSAYLHRITRHLLELKDLPAWLAAAPQNLLSSFGLGERKEVVLTGTVRDAFGLRKFAIFVTRFGSVVGVDAGNKGAVLWRLPLNVTDVMNGDVRGLFAIRKGVFVLVLENANVYTIDVFTGELLEKDKLAGNSKVDSSSIVDSANGEKRWLLILPQKAGAQGWAYPKTDAQALRAAVKTTSMTRADSTLRGFKLTVADDYRLVLINVWSFYPPLPEKLTGIVTRPPHDPVASIGKVLGDRSVLYKYLNPNLLLVTTIKAKQSTVIVYLLDSVSGNILHTVSYKDVDVSRPVISTMSENWFVVSFFSTSTARGYQLVVNEMYTSALKNDRGPAVISGQNVSSLSTSRSAAPYVTSQAYVFPHQIASMTTTTTRQGITTRSLILSIPSIGSLLALPKRLLDPRRPVGREPTNEEKEEGLFKYDPVIGVDYARGSLSHSRNLFGVYKIMTSPALLESTCLVIGWGLDIFGTKVTPSEAFDILDKGFNKPALLATVVALAIGTMALAPMVRRKQINQRWAQH